MREPMRRVLVVQHSSSRDGSAFSGLLLTDGLRDAGWETHVVFGHPGPMETLYAEQGHAVHVVPHKNWLRRAHPLRFVHDVWTEVRTAQAMEQLIDRIRPNIVYINTAVSLAAAVAARRQGIPCIWHLRELFADVGGEMRAPRFVRSFTQRVFNRMATQLVAPSRAVAANMLGALADRVTVVPNAADDSFFENALSRTQARQQLGLPTSQVVIGVPGTLRPMKGHSFFFNAVRPLLKERPDVLVAVTGSGEESYVAALEKQVADVGIAASVCFLGVVADMHAFYRSCDVVCIPSEAEPFGRTVIEAMASRTPVVATAVGGINETVGDGITGKLVPYGDEVGLVGALRCLLDDEQLGHRLAEGAYLHAKRYFHEQVYQQRITAFVEAHVAEANQPMASIA